jgi:hypothetical protein
MEFNMNLYFLIIAIAAIFNIEVDVKFLKRFWGKRAVKKISRWVAFEANRANLPLEYVKGLIEAHFCHQQWLEAVSRVGRKPLGRSLTDMPVHRRKSKENKVAVSPAYKEYAAALAARCRNPQTILFLSERGVRFEEEVCLDAGLFHDGLEKLVEPDARNVDGTWVHVFNKAHSPEALLASVSAVQLLDGEICVSSYSSGRWFAKEGNAFIGVVLKGTVSEYFSGDVYSHVRKNGKRYPSRKGIGGHDEGFLNPFREGEVHHFLAGPDCPDWKVEALHARGWKVERVTPPQGKKARRVVAHPPENLWERKAREAGHDL